MFIAFAVEQIPPFLLSCIRYWMAAVILFALAGALGQLKDLQWAQIKRSVLVGMAFIGIGSGGVAWALQRLDSGFTALLISSQPLIVVFLLWAIRGKKPTLLSFFGIALGMFGVYLLVSQNEIVASTDQWHALLMILTCLLVWGRTSIYVGTADLPKSFIVNTGFQMIGGGAVCYAISLALSEPAVAWGQLDSFIWFSLFYLIVLGAALVFIAFNYLLKNVSPEKVATSTYIHPVIALLLGWYFRDELITGQSIAAAAIMLTGVFFINFEWAFIKARLQSFRRYLSKAQ